MERLKEKCIDIEAPIHLTGGSKPCVTRSLYRLPR